MGITEKARRLIQGTTDKKRAFMLLRYTFIIAAGYLVLFEGNAALDTRLAAVIVGAIISNVLLSCASEGLLFAWYVQLPVVVADTLWISYCLRDSGVGRQDFFLLYFFVLTLAAVGENLAIVLAGAVLVGAANMYFAVTSGSVWSSHALIRIPFFFTVALFYGDLAMNVRQERKWALRGRMAADQLGTVVEGRTQALVAKAQELESMWAQAQEASLLKAEFVATLSHEFLTPLHIVLGYIDLLLEARDGSGLDTNARRLAERIQQNARRLVDMVHGILDFARLESGKVAVLKTPVDLAVLTQELINPVRLQRRAGVTARYELDEPLPEIVTDVQKLRALITQLLSNAVKFTHQGEVVFAVRYDAASHCIQFSVRDTGIGIQADDLQVIFEEFRQVDSSARRRYEGVGLGLAIARRYAQLLGGKLSVESKAGSGSCFTFALPCAAELSSRVPTPPGLRLAAAGGA